MARIKTDESEIKDQTTNYDKNKDELFAKMIEQMSEMQEKIEKLEKENANKNSDTKENDIEELKLDDDITVISQCVGTLTLSTDGKGEGNVYRFSHFGEIQDIPWGDLKDICRNMKSLAQKGAFYIVNDEAVKKARLKPYYDKLLKNDDIMHLFEKDANTIIELYKLANDFQKEIIIDLITNKKLNKEYVDGGVLFTLSELSGKKLMNIE